MSSKRAFVCAQEKTTCFTSGRGSFGDKLAQNVLAKSSLLTSYRYTSVY